MLDDSRWGDDARDRDDDDWRDRGDRDGLTSGRDPGSYSPRDDQLDRDPRDRDDDRRGLEESGSQNVARPAGLGTARDEPTASRGASQGRRGAEYSRSEDSRPAGLEPATPGLGIPRKEATRGSANALPLILLVFRQTPDNRRPPRAATDCQSFVSRLSPLPTRAETIRDRGAVKPHDQSAHRCLRPGTKRGTRHREDTHAGPKIISLSTCARICSEEEESGGQGIHQTICDLNAAISSDVQPNFVQIGFSLWCEAMRH